MQKTYFTRRNLIFIALAALFSFLLIFVGICLEGDYSLVNSKNPIAGLAALLNFQVIKPKLAGFVTLALVAVYVIVYAVCLVYIRRFSVVRGKNPFRVKCIILYVLFFILCAVLSVGAGALFVAELTKENVILLLIFIGQTLAVTVIIYSVMFMLIAAVTMLVINFFLVDKPFRFFNKKMYAEIEDDDTKDVDVTSSFDATLNANAAGGVAAGYAGAPIPGMESMTQDDVEKATKLDDREKVFPGLSTLDQQYDGYAIDSIESEDITLEELCVKFRDYLAGVENLYFDMDIIRIFVSAFAASHFMILEGLSGTGKSSLPRYFAKFTSANLLFVPVQATWRDKSSLLGYFNDFSKTYTETEFLLSLYDGNYNPDRLSIYVLDEMNISRVEYYFADFLSVLEYPEEVWRIKLMQLPYGFVPPAKLEDGYIQIPANSYFVGTANKDDSTFSIADKVYDRAITIDFENRLTPFKVNDIVSPIVLSKTHLQNLYDEAIARVDYQLTPAELERFMGVCDFIYENLDVAIGNRILKQIEELVPTFVACGGKKEDALDFLLTRKVIVKLEGRFEEHVKDGLKRLLVLLEKTYGAGTFVKSERLIRQLLRKL
jgi:hypothetical protein